METQKRDFGPRAFGTREMDWILIWTMTALGALNLIVGPLPERFRQVLQVLG